MKSVLSAPIKNGTKIFVASDLDVPMQEGEIQDTYRLDKLTPTLQFIINKGGIPVIGGHIGRPKGKIIDELSTEQLRPYFDLNLGENNYELLENLRFDPREESGDEGFAKELAGKAELFVNEVFSTSHRKDASICGVPKYLPGYAGLRLVEELETLDQLKSAPERPFVVIIGGAKLEDKKPVVSKFLEIADDVLLGGKIGLDWTEDVPNNLYLPTDYAMDNKDLGPKTLATYESIILAAKTVLWAGPVGMYEDEMYIKGCKQIAQAMATATKNFGTKTIVGGGDTTDVLSKLGLRDGVSFVSTGGGAMLDYLAYGTLPGIEALG